MSRKDVCIWVKPEVESISFDVEDIIYEILSIHGDCEGKFIIEQIEEKLYGITEIECKLESIYIDCLKGGKKFSASLNTLSENHDEWTFYIDRDDNICVKNPLREDAIIPYMRFIYSDDSNTYFEKGIKLARCCKIEYFNEYDPQYFNSLETWFSFHYELFQDTYFFTAFTAYEMNKDVK